MNSSFKVGLYIRLSRDDLTRESDSIVSQRSYTTCDYYRTYSKYHICTTHTNNYEVLEKVILDNIREVCKKYLDKNKILVI